MTRRSIELYFFEDHRRIDGIFKKFQDLEQKNLAEACKVFYFFKNELLDHIFLEESILFPVFEEKTLLRDMGPSIDLHCDHVKITKLLEKIQEKIDKGLTAVNEENEFLGFFKQHEFKEEQILYSVIDELTTYVERDDMFNKILRFARHESTDKELLSGKAGHKI